MSTWSPDRYSAAWSFATEAHDGQTYGGPAEGQQVPYIHHIGEVAAEVLRAVVDVDCDADLAVGCALLHDTVEDTEVTLEQVRERFGDAVADGVAALSKDETLPTKAAQMADSLARIRQQPREVWMVKLADRIVNLAQPPFYWSRAKATAYRAEAQTILEALGEAHPGLAARLATKIERYRQWTDESHG